MKPSEDVLRHKGLVRLVARKAARRGVDFDDAMQDGWIGLLKYGHRWTKSSGVSFSTAAYQKISSQVRDGERARSVNPMRWRPGRKIELYAAKARLRATLFREPNLYEVAEELGVAVEVVWELEARVSGLRGSHHHPYIEDGRKKSDRLVLMLAVKSRMGALVPREVQVLAMFYYDGLSLGEIADVLGLTISRIGQIRKGAIQQIKAGLS